MRAWRVEKPSQGTKPLDKIFENDAIVNIIFPFLDRNSPFFSLL